MHINPAMKGTWLAWRWTRRAARVVLFSVVIFGAGDSSAQADPKTIQEVICKYACPPLDRGLKKVDEAVRLGWARWRGRTRSMTPPPVAGRGKSCGRMPDDHAQCCANQEASIWVEYAGEDPYRFPEVPWRARCQIN